jgi:dimethylhistidine N-methyltransferase
VSRLPSSVLDGLFAPTKSLPTWLLYDAVGSALYERITALPEYYLSRAEAEVFERHGREIVALAGQGAAELSVAEIGAGSAEKTRVLARYLAEERTRGVFLACDISAAALEMARENLAAADARVEVRTCLGSHLDAGPAIQSLPGRQLLLWVGSSIGNHPDDEAVKLLRELCRSLRPDARLLLGTDLKKDPAVLVAAYDDAAGVTAQFTKNVLGRLNRELDCNFDLADFRHVAEWNAETSNMEISLEALRAVRIVVEGHARPVELARGERIHIEISAKYDEARALAILEAAGFTRERRFLDAAGRYAVELARVVA